MLRCRHSFFHFVSFLIVLAAGLVSCRTVEVLEGGPLSLVQALQDSSVDSIVLGGDYSVAKDLPGPLPAPIQVSRNLTITGKAGAEPPVTLDLAFRRAVVLLCETCSITLKNLTLKNARRGSGAALDFFVGDERQGATAVLLENVYRLRLACTPGSDTAEVLENTPRSKVLPNPNGKQQFAVKPTPFQGTSYPDAVHLVDYTLDLPLTHQEGRGHAAAAHWGGYALGSRNVVYLCQRVVSEACLAEKAPDACVNELIDALLSKSTPQQPGPPLAAILVPVMLVGALLAALAVWVVYRRRQRQRKQDKELQDKVQYPPALGYSFVRTNTGIMGPPGGSVTGLDSASEVYSTHKSQGGRRSLEVAMQPRGLQQGWQLVSSATAKFVQAPAGTDNDVEFGVFLGAGSYGRVYRARWAGQDVACKVIQHDRSTLAAVEAEADLMLTLHHPNVVKAFHYCTFTYTEPLYSEKSRGSRHWSQAGQQRASSSGSQSSGGSQGPRNPGPPGPGADSAQQLNRTSAQTNSASNSGSSARVMLLRQQQRLQQQLPQAQQQEDTLLRHDSSDVLITNLSLDDQAAQEAVTIASSIAGISATTTKGSTESNAAAKVLARPSVDAGTVGTGEPAVKHKAETWLVQEYCDMGTLGGIASSWDEECDEQMLERLHLLRDTAQGLEALHANHVVHGDVNARNVLVSSCSSSETGMSAKVADLGLARCLAHHATHRTTNSCGTMSHMAPELLRYGRLSPAVDIYAFGIMMWELYSQGQAAFDKLHYGQFFETVVLRKLRPCVPAGMPADYALVMCQCWAADPAERPSVSVLRACLELMLQDRQHRVDAAAAVLAAAAAAPNAADASGARGSAANATAAAAAALPPPGMDVLPALQALLPQQKQPRGPSPHGQQQAAGASSDAAVAQLSNSTLSNVSLSVLFPDAGTPTGSDTVLFVGEEEAAGVCERAAAARTAARPVVRPAVNRASPGPAVGSPLAGSDVEAQLDTSVHNNRVWFV